MFVVTGSRHVNVNLKGTGRFFCLYCEAERSYQHREWRTTSVLFFIPLTRGGEFILCPDCESAYDLECLDESSTATYDELMVDVPDVVIRARARVHPGEGLSLAQYIGAAPSGGEGIVRGGSGPGSDSDRVRPKRRESLSAHSAVRRH